MSKVCVSHPRWHANQELHLPTCGLSSCVNKKGLGIEIKGTICFSIFESYLDFFEIISDGMHVFSSNLRHGMECHEIYLENLGAVTSSCPLYHGIMWVNFLDIFCCWCGAKKRRKSCMRELQPDDLSTRQDDSLSKGLFLIMCALQWNTFLSEAFCVC